MDDPRQVDREQPHRPGVRDALTRLRATIHPDRRPVTAAPLVLRDDLDRPEGAAEPGFAADDDLEGSP